MKKKNARSGAASVVNESFQAVRRSTNHSKATTRNNDKEVNRLRSQPVNKEKKGSAGVTNPLKEIKYPKPDRPGSA